MTADKCFASQNLLRNFLTKDLTNNSFWFKGDQYDWCCHFILFGDLQWQVKKFSGFGGLLLLILFDIFTLLF